MQHWHVYRKWNQNLFEELYVAYLNGRMDKDPTDFWYKGEFGMCDCALAISFPVDLGSQFSHNLLLLTTHHYPGFFDFYIIPLTQKLKDCGVFGVSSGELLNYAKKNREEWELKGEQVVAELAAEARRKYGEKTVPKEDIAPVVDC